MVYAKEVEEEEEVIQKKKREESEVVETNTTNINERLETPCVSRAIESRILSCTERKKAKSKTKTKSK